MASRCKILLLFYRALASLFPELRHGKFDFIKIDSANSRLLACHTGNGSLDMIDTTTSKLIKSIPTGNAQGVANDSRNNRYFVSVSGRSWLRFSRHIPASVPKRL
jgi:hypothetical protein